MGDFGVCGEIKVFLGGECPGVRETLAVGPKELVSQKISSRKMRNR
jgi:hypothetical protein